MARPRVRHCRSLGKFVPTFAPGPILTWPDQSGRRDRRLSCSSAKVDPSGRLALQRLDAGGASETNVAAEMRPRARDRGAGMPSGSLHDARAPTIRKMPAIRKMKEPRLTGALTLVLHHAHGWRAITTDARGHTIHRTHARSERLPNRDARSERSVGRASRDTRRNTGRDAKIEARSTRNSRYRNNKGRGNRVARSRPVVEPREPQRKGAPAGTARNRPHSQRPAIRPRGHTWLVHF